MVRRNLEKERQVYERMWLRHSEASREYTERHFDAVKSQDPQGCDTGGKVKPVFLDEQEEVEGTK